MLRKLHSLSGVLPLGVFLVLHLWTNAHALLGRQSFDDKVHASIEMPFALVLEFVFLVVPLAFHALYGIRLSFIGKPEVAYPYAKNWGYVMQRVTGLVALVFIVAHLFQFRFQRLSGKLEAIDFYGELCRGLSSTQAGVPWLALGYLVGLAACVFHFANGLVGFCFSWGITTSERATRRSSLVFGVLGVLLFTLGASVVIYFATGSRLLFAAEDTGVFSTKRTCQHETVRFGMEGHKQDFAPTTEAQETLPLSGER